MDIQRPTSKDRDFVNRVDNYGWAQLKAGEKAGPDDRMLLAVRRGACGTGMDD
jgi:hypothetical protein